MRKSTEKSDPEKSKSDDGARRPKTDFSDLGQTRRNYHSVGGVLECLSLDLIAYLVKFSKKSLSVKSSFQ